MMLMRGKASACGSATVVNAISAGKGAAFAVDLRVYAEVDLRGDVNNITGHIGNTPESPLLIETCVEKVLEFYGVEEDYGGGVKTAADLPIAVGLSSSSAAANATILATSIALGEDLRPEKAIELGIKASFDADTTITGAYDDAAASFYGGGVVTDNRDRVLLKRFNVDPELKVLILLPPEKSYTSDIDVGRTKLISELIDSAHREALSGNPFGAQTLNGLLYSSVLGHDPRPAIDALEAGALSAGLSGTGPAVVAITDDENVEKIEEKWKGRSDEIIVTRPSEVGAREEDE